MKQALFAVGVMALAVPVIQASIIVLGDGPFGMLIDAHLDVPQNPNSNPVSQMVAYRHYTEGFTVTVTGAMGRGFLEFSGYLFANSFNGSASSECMGSWSQIASSYGIATTPWAPQGGTPISFGFGGPEVGVDFTFGVPQSFTLIADSYVSYQFYPLIAGVPPYLAGTALDSSVFLDCRVGVYSYNQNALLQDATVIFGVPEPGQYDLAGRRTMYYVCPSPIPDFAPAIPGKEEEERSRSRHLNPVSAPISRAALRNPVFAMSECIAQNVPQLVSQNAAQRSPK